MNFKISISWLVFALVILASCEGPKQTRLPRHSGKPGEILLVMDESKWLGVEGDSLRAVFERFYPQLPQGEPAFSLLQFSQSEMSNLLRHHRNIMRVRIGTEAEGRNKVTLTRDKWASNQLVFTAYAENENEWFDLVRNEFPKVVDLINETEINRLQSRYRETGNNALQERVADRFGFRIYWPSDCEVAETHEDFWWIKRERVKYLGNTPHDIVQGFFIYTYPYASDSAFTQSAILAVRDSLTKEYVPGPRAGTYMTTEYRYPPESETVTVDGRYAVLTRGLWRTENYFMGGPFVSLTTTDPSGERIVSVSGFVFSPKFDKREFIREVEAVVRSLHYPATPGVDSTAVRKR